MLEARHPEQVERPVGPAVVHQPVLGRTHVLADDVPLRSIVPVWKCKGLDSFEAVRREQDGVEIAE